MKKLSVPASLQNYYSSVLGFNSVMLSTEHSMYREKLLDKSTKADGEESDKNPEMKINILSSQKAEWLFIVTGKSVEFDDEKSSLFHKMLAAMKLNINLVSCIYLQEQSGVIPDSKSIQDLVDQSAKILAFGSLAKDFVANYTKGFNSHRLSYHHNKKMMATHSLSEILQNPNLKKPAWDDMKKIMQN